VNKRSAQLISVLIILIVLIVVVLSAIRHIQPSYTVSRTYSPSASAFSATAAFGSQSFVFSNDNALVTYDYITHQTNALSANVGISDSPIDTMSVSANKQFVLFHDDMIATNGTLYQQLQNQGLSPQEDYWWIYSVTKHSFSVLPQAILLARMDGNNVVALTDSGNDESLTNYNPATLVASNTINIPSIDGFFPLKSGYLLQTSNNEILSTINGVVSQPVVKNATLVGATLDGQTIAVVLETSSSHQLVLINTQTQKQQLIATNIVGQPVWSTNGAILFTTNTSSDPNATTLYTYNLTNHKKLLWKFSDSSAAFATKSLETTALYGDTNAIVNTNSSTYYLIQPITK
jgi:hypothetical protein